MELTHITCCGETAPLSVDSPLRCRYRADRAVSACRIVIRKATVRTKILKLNHLSFVEVLRQKMSNS